MKNRGRKGLAGAARLIKSLQLTAGTVAISLLAPSAWAQQPFITDDTDVAEVHRFHLELLSEYDSLQKTAYPTVRQNTTRLQLTYGLLRNLEIGVDGPLLYIQNAAGAPNAFGFGDVDFQAKYRIISERENSPRPAIAMGLYIEIPSGDPRNQLGSGLADYWLNSIVQKSLNSKLTYRLNAGILFSGNTLTGAIGIISTRGQVYTGSSSATYQLTKRWLLGIEVAGAFTQQFNLGKSQLQVLTGSKYELTRTVGLDFAVTGGKFEGSPRLGGAFGISVDF
jgi:hypothetical protein